MAKRYIMKRTSPSLEEADLLCYISSSAASTPTSSSTNCTKAAAAAEDSSTAANTTASGDAASSSSPTVDADAVAASIIARAAKITNTKYVDHTYTDHAHVDEDDLRSVNGSALESWAINKTAHDHKHGNILSPFPGKVSLCVVLAGFRDVLFH